MAMRMRQYAAASCRESLRTNMAQPDAGTYDRRPREAAMTIPKKARGALLGVLCCACGWAWAQDAVQRRGTERDAVAFVVGNVEFLLLHEIGHLLIGEKDIPIIGPEENAADYIATLALLREEPLDPSQADRALRFLVAAADAFASAWLAGTESGAEVPYWGSHALSIQRYYQIACLLFGSDTTRYARVPRIAGLPPERAASCSAEYERASRSIDWLLRNYGRAADDPPGVKAQVVYEPPPTRVAATIRGELEKLQLLEGTLERLHERFAVTRPFTLVMRSCGASEAAWVPDRRELVICYELIDTLYLLALRPSAISVPDGVAE
jgi:hypothetical protein